MDKCIRYHPDSSAFKTNGGAYCHIDRRLSSFHSYGDVLLLRKNMGLHRLGEVEQFIGAHVRAESGFVGYRHHYYIHIYLLLDYPCDPNGQREIDAP